MIVSVSILSFFTQVDGNGKNFISLGKKNFFAQNFYFIIAFIIICYIETIINKYTMYLIFLNIVFLADIYCNIFPNKNDENPMGNVKRNIRYLLIFGHLNSEKLHNYLIYPQTVYKVDKRSLALEIFFDNRLQLSIKYHLRIKYCIIIIYLKV